ncbi:MAG: AAA family ATPase [Chlamydiota bacterium]
MFSFLKIKNLILIEHAEISFGPGLNILTGETGAGKSAILSAIRLISGERADAGLIRSGADLAVIEATFSAYSSNPFIEEGVELPPPASPLHIRREIHRSGRSRAFVEDQQVSLSFLRKCVGHAIEQIDQSSSQSLSLLDAQREILDLFADLSAETALFIASFNEETAIAVELQNLYQLQTQSERELEWARHDLKIIEEVNWKEKEEETLAEEHQFLASVEELAEKIHSISSALTEGTAPCVPLLKRLSAALENCTRFDAKLQPYSQTMRSAALEMEEVGRTIGAYAEGLEANPARLAALEKRISEIEAVKRRFGPSWEEVENTKRKKLAQIDQLTNLENRIEEVQCALKRLKEKNLSSARFLSQKRQSAAPVLASAVEAELKSLNLSSAQFQISLHEKTMSSNGCDEVRFLFSGNPGTLPISLGECASGGEISRLNLAIQTTLAEKEGSSTLVFDEIDSNVGGQTAVVLGEKLKKIARGRQVICVTHFVQVARFAAEHFLVAKREKDGMAFTVVSKLKAKERELEYNRMLGVD